MPEILKMSLICASHKAYYKPVITDAFRNGSHPDNNGYIATVENLIET